MMVSLKEMQSVDLMESTTDLVKEQHLESYSGMMMG